ncbi:MAG: PaaI family thioesterase [SAR324 cluster bacterium]|nr:PaaI family thioesterase [SAR324 cluster bacterium]
MVLDDKRREFLKNDYEQGFPAFCGLKAGYSTYGHFEAQLQLRPEHLQQNGFVHAGLMATMADHTAGYSAYTTVADDIHILTIEFKINLFKPAVGRMIICRSKVINKGKKIIISESELFSVVDETEKLVSKATVTLMAVPDSELR